MVNYDSALLTCMHINFLKIQSLCGEFADFQYHTEGGGHSSYVAIKFDDGCCLGLQYNEQCIECNKVHRL